MNWSVTKDTARKTVACPDRLNAAQQRAITDAVSLAEIWLDQATSFRGEYDCGRVEPGRGIEQTMPVWRRRLEPSRCISPTPWKGTELLQHRGGCRLARNGWHGKDAAANAAYSGASMFGLQLGQGLVILATEVVGATDIGQPLSETGARGAAADQRQGLRRGPGTVERRCHSLSGLAGSTRQRLFASAGWLRSQMLALVEQYASGITIDTGWSRPSASSMPATSRI